MLKKYMGILMVNEDEKDIRGLTKHRPIATIPIGSRFRVIDFTLSNMVNAGINTIGVIAKADKTKSIVDHVKSGKEWDLDRKSGGLFFIPPTVTSGESYDVNAFKSNMEFFHRAKAENVILSSSYVISKIDYKKAAKAHKASGNDITVIYKKTTKGDRKYFGCDTLNFSEDGRLVSSGKNIGKESDVNLSMEMFIMKKEILMNLLFNSAQKGIKKALKDVIMDQTAKLKMGGFEYTGYAEFVNSTSAYHKINLDLLKKDVTKELFFNNGPVYTKVKDTQPSLFKNDSKVTNSLIANGCIIDGEVENSVLSRRVIVSKKASVKNCIILQACEIGEGVHLENVIIDKNVKIGNYQEVKGSPEYPVVIEKKNIFETSL